MAAAVDETETAETDETLIARAGAGDDTAFEALVGRYAEHAGRIMWRFSHDPDAHAELVHEVFVQVYLSLDKFRGEAPFVHWLSALASRTGFRWWKKQARSNRFCQLPDDFADTRPAAETAAEKPDGDDLFRMLADLQEADRMALTLMYYEKKNSKEIAALMGWTHTATRMRISRARKKLQQIAKAHGIVWEE